VQLCCISIGEHRAFAGDAIDIGSVISHDAHAVSTDVVAAYVISPDHEDVRFLLLCMEIDGRDQYPQENEQRNSFLHLSSNEIFQAL
jgi:hypothetical protein